MNAKEPRDRDLTVQIEACETNVWAALLNGDIQADQDALDESFLGVYSDGFAGKEGHVQQLANGPTIASYALSGIKVRELGPDFAVISYRADFSRSGKSEAEAMYVSSIWRRKEAGWINVFSQDTPAVA